MALIILAAWFVLLTAYGAWHWRRPKQDRLDGWWHWLPAGRTFPTHTWELACIHSTIRSRARRGEEG